MHSSDQPVEDSKTRMLSTVVLTAAFCLLISQIDIRLLVFRWGRITVHWGRKEETTPEENKYTVNRFRKYAPNMCRQTQSKSKPFVARTMDVKGKPNPKPACCKLSHALD